MIFKLIVFGVFAATVMQCDNVTPSEEFSDGQEPQNWKDVFEAFAEQIKNSTDSSRKTLFNLKDNLQKQKGQIVEKLLAKLKSEGTSLLRELSELKEQARIMEIDIGNCIADGEQRIIDLPVNFTKEVLRCREDLGDEGNAIIHGSLSAVQDAVEDLEVLGNNFNKCYGRFEFKCQAEVTSQAGNVAASISAHLSTAVIGATKYISGLEESLQACGFGKIYIAVSKGQRIIKNVSRCVDSHVKPILLN